MDSILRRLAFAAALAALPPLSAALADGERPPHPSGHPDVITDPFGRGTGVIGERNRAEPGRAERNEPPERRPKPPPPSERGIDRDNFEMLRRPSPYGGVLDR